MTKIANNTEQISSPAKENVERASQNRDALALQIYDKLFDWLVSKMNKSINNSQTKANDSKSIGLLDIFGFENFSEISDTGDRSYPNSFEQICINYTNEKLQALFNDHVISSELHTYKTEGVSLGQISYDDNRECLDLLYDGTPSIFKQLDKLSLRSGDLSNISTIFHQQMHSDFHKKNSKFRDNVKYFIISHYAEDVWYDPEGMVEKNKIVNNL